MNEDKRKFIRFEGIIPIVIKKIEPEQPVKGRVVIDEFSREGIRLSLESNVQPGSLMELNLHLPESDEPASIKGVVMWSRPEGDKILIGLKINEMDAAAKAEIFDMVYTMWIETRSEEIENKLKEKDTPGQ
ncbi:PilZ domain-containing protein [Acidobacteriota bacterium]